MHKAAPLVRALRELCFLRVPLRYQRHYHLSHLPLLTACQVTNRRASSVAGRNPEVIGRVDHVQSVKRGRHNENSPVVMQSSPLNENHGVGKAERPRKRSHEQDPRLAKWDLTVGVEIHAELSTQSKLFSISEASSAATPNTNASVFDTAFPGAQPHLQREVLLPALRAAIALNCQIQEESSWDRKHYFWWDQPQGYQITQYYQPFARDGHVVLYPWDDIDSPDAKESEGGLRIGIKQVQLEQDTAKTILQPPDTYLLDFNRAGVPLVEIITRPEIKSPKTAAALVRKIQALLQSVGANFTGMEMGGLRADVNVSVRSKDAEDARSTFEYDGITGLGQRTEIKNLSSIKAVEEAIIAERDRQIAVLESGGTVEGETRGWSLGATTTRRLRGKEGEVDYRYMPDPDLAPLRIERKFVQQLRLTMPKTQDEWLGILTSAAGEKNVRLGSSLPDAHGLSLKDAQTLVNMDGGDRLEFYLDTLSILRQKLHDRPNTKSGTLATEVASASKVVCNW